MPFLYALECSQEEETLRMECKRVCLTFFVVCDKILPLVTAMTIDELGQNSLTKYKKNNVIKSDHCRLDLEVDLVFHKEKHHLAENAFNVRNKLCQKTFLEYTTYTDMFTKCFTSQKDLEHKFNTWQSKFQKSLYACFRKIRVTDGEIKAAEIDNLMTQKNR